MDSLPATFRCRPPVRETALRAAEKALPAKLPRDYLEFLASANGGEGLIGESYVMLWSVNSLTRMNRQYEVEKYAAGLLVFGSNGGGEAYGFDTRHRPWPVVQLPFVGMDWSLAERLGASFRGFLRHLKRTRSSGCESRQPDAVCSKFRGKEIFEVQPIVLGGSPTDPANKIGLNRNEHIQAVVFWNRKLSELRNGS